MSTAAGSSASVTFAPAERVLCYHGPLVYEAKVLKAETWDERSTRTGATGAHYLVHYKGWKQTWDEWVPPPRLLKWNETSLALQKSLQAQAHPAGSGAGAASASAVGGSGAGAGTKAKGERGAGGAGGRAGGRKDGARGTKRGRDEDEANKRPEMRLTVPEALKIILVDDWEAVTKNAQLVTLPREPTVVQLLDQFKDYILSQPKPPPHLRDPELILPVIVSGLQVYFDRALGANLLYRFERVQLVDVRRLYVTGPTVKYGQEKEPSAIYGAEHLLRMLVSLPQMVAGSSMDAESVSLVKDYVNELMQWMVQERSRIFQAEYESASAAYQNLARS